MIEILETETFLKTKMVNLLAKNIKQLRLKSAHFCPNLILICFNFDRVEVDCSGIFKPGQLGVAIGRARTSTGLRVINFSQRACMPHPESVENFLLLPSKEPLTDKSCCRIVQRYFDNLARSSR